MNILELIKNEKYYVKIDESFRKIMIEKYESSKKKIKISASNETIKRILYRDHYFTKQDTYFSLTKTLGFSKQDANNGILLVKTRRSFPIPVREIKLNKAFMRILGHILGDGGIHIIEEENKYRVFYVNNEKVLLNSFIDDIKFVFGDIKIYFRERTGHGDEVWLPSSVGFLLYNILEYEKNYKIKRVPLLILTINCEKHLGVFLQAIFDDDGYISVNKHMIVISLVNEDLLKDIRSIFQKLNIGVNKIQKIVPKNRSTMYTFSITSKTNIFKYAKLVGFLHPMKKQRLKMLVKKYNGEL
jgi:hypothetical protein